MTQELYRLDFFVDDVFVGSKGPWETMQATRGRRTFWKKNLERQNMMGWPSTELVGRLKIRISATASADLTWTAIEGDL